jgi:hypothetical protein
MESKEIIRPENEEIQNIEAISGASEEGQIIVEETVTSNEECQEAMEEDVVTVTENEPIAEENMEMQEQQEEEMQEAIEEEVAKVTENELIAEENTEIQEQQEEKIEEQQEEAIEEQQEEEIEDEEEEEVTIKSADSIEAEYALLTCEESVTKLEQLVSEPNFNLIKLNVGVLRGKILDFIKEERGRLLETFLADGGVKEEFVAEPTTLEERFHKALQKFKDNKAKFLDNLEEEKQKNLVLKQNVINSLKELIETESNLKVLNDKFKEFQETWKEIGPVPQNESANLWQNYHFYVEKFFDILRINKELRSLDLKKNLEQKIALCEQAEELLVDDSIIRSFKKLQTLHEEWKEIGPVPEDKKEEIWERFKNASDKINQRRREHYEQIFTEQQNNYNAKVVLCEKAEELLATEIKSPKEQRIVSEQFTELLKVWKTLGPIPSKLSEEIWKRFKGSLDQFFQEHKEQVKKSKEEQTQNYNLKLNLAIRAEGVADRTDWAQAAAEIIALQKEWKEVGPVPYKYSDAIWKRFRAACDKFFKAKSNYFANKQEIEAENLIKKEALIEKIKNQKFGEDKNANIEILKEIQREWTEIGYVTKSEQDRIYKSYREVINKRFEELKINVGELQRDKFRSHINTILDDPNAGKLLSKERGILQSKLKELKDDVLLWENNLGFFAHSKNADLLREEFTKKIDSAKAQIKDLEYKIRMLNNPKKSTEENKTTEEAKGEEKKETPVAE